MKIHIYKEGGGHRGDDLIYTHCGKFLLKKEKHLYRKTPCKSVTCKICLKAKTIKREMLNPMKMAVRNKPYTVIDYGHVHQYVGIGWVDERKATKEDHKKYPVVVD